jgi:hypothetical protein
MIHQQGVCPVADITMRAKRFESRRHSEKIVDSFAPANRETQALSGGSGAARFGPRSAKHSSTGSLLCQQARHRWLHRFAALPPLPRLSKVKAIVVHMPAMNTPQFTWVKSRLPILPQPVPPIYEPEVGAGAILHAALRSSPRPE